MGNNDYFYELSKPNTLLILGNGFDKYCGLASSFEDYFKARFFFGNGSHNDRLIADNVWNLIFFFRFYANHSGGYIDRVYSDDIKWMDIEGFINDLFKTKNLHFINRTYDLLNAFIASSEMDREFETSLMINGDNVYLNGDSKNQPFYLCRAAYKWKVSGNKQSTIEFLLNELKRFEKDFTQYLIEQVNSSKNYTSNIYYFFENILDNNGTRKHYIVNFNYTTCCNQFVDNNSVNIHGTLEGNDIIIGIDNDSREGRFGGADVFTKLDRRVKNKSAIIKPPSKEDIDRILVFGHSLGRQDYSYFRYIFEKYSALNQNIQIVFLYSRYKKTAKENDDIFSKLVDSARELIDYCENNTDDFKGKRCFETKYSNGELLFMTLDEYHSNFC